MTVTKAALSFLAGVLIFQSSSALPEHTYLTLLPLFTGLSIKYSWARPVLVAILAYTWSHYFALSLIYPKLSPELEGKKLIVLGTIKEVKADYPDYVQILLQVDNSSMKRAGGNIPGKILLNWYKTTNELSVNQVCQLQIKLKRFWRLANPGSLDWEKVMFLRGIGARGYISKGHCHDPPEEAMDPGRLRSHLLHASAEKVAQFEHAGTMLALTFGVRDDLTQAQWEVLRKTGTAHLLAISGLHISSIAVIIFLITKTICKRFAWLCNRISAQRFASIIALLCATFYAYLAGFSLPTQRALIMVTVALLAIYFYHPVMRTSVLATALLLILIMNPMSVLYPGFWLSFSAVAFIYIAIRASAHLSKPFRVIFIQLYLGAALLPLSLLFLQQGSLIAPLANLVAVPWVSFLVLPVLFCAQLINALGIDIAGGLFYVANTLLDILWSSLTFSSDFKYSSTSFIVTIFAVVSYELGLLLLVFSRRLFVKVLGCLYISAIFFMKEPALRQNEMRMTALDVGQGLAVLIETQNHSLLFDAGYQSPSGFSMGKAVVAPYLAHRNIKQLDTSVVSHNDNDHAGGMHHLLENTKVKKLLVSNLPELYQYHHTGYCRAGDEWSWDGVVFRILHPQHGWASNDNNRSCVLQVIHPKGKILLTGDIEASTEKVLSRTYGDKLASEILIVPHHGSKSSSSDPFLSRVQPRFAVFSTAYKNRYGFPHADILRRYRKMGVAIADTQSEGAVIVTINADKGIQMAPGYRMKSQRYWHASANTSN